ncbi:MAG: YihY/virulence factor BrkB family protein [Flavobacteriales bacterium]|nr:YihY/virulence factor BrkB family protein [Flavobacteriales bacterium]
MLNRIKRKVLFSRVFRRLVGRADDVVLPGFEGFSIYRIGRFFLQALSDGQLAMRASAIAFKVFIAFFPAVIMLLTLIPFIPIDDFQIKLLVTFRDLLPPEVYKFIETTLHDLLVKKHGTLLSVSFLIGLYLASNSIDAILQGFSQSTNLHTWHSPLKQRLLSLGLLLVLPILGLIGIPVLTMSGIAIDRLTDYSILTSQVQLYALIAAKWLISTLLVLGFVSMLYAAGDPTSPKFRLITPGALLAMFLVLVISQALAFVFSNITDYNALYGSIGAILAVQLWIYFNMIALLIGHELNSAIVKARVDHRANLKIRKLAASPV